ncbi:hypothetical protein M0813_18325 [Anaeramoeba flamelloides]|uniref:Uncharacterized protein n=1 Tax=Anaeramoeba flamelloides TaxID=1746091 RepID=A0ABQ8YT13_9EUKA|nr:hypothetical protein M0813_18325 [Anaeramoeba flamelloides]
MKSVQLRRENLFTTNSGCKIDEVPYYLDGNTQILLCGKCEPGTSGLEDPSQCEIDEYCSDEAQCVKLTNSPFWKSECGFGEAGLTKDGMCGPGLYCINKACIQCDNLQEDNTDGKICVDNLWSYNKLILSRDPITFCLSIIIFLFVFFKFITTCFRNKWLRLKLGLYDDHERLLHENIMGYVRGLENENENENENEKYNENEDEDENEKIKKMNNRNSSSSSISQSGSDSENNLHISIANNLNSDHDTSDEMKISINENLMKKNILLKEFTNNEKDQKNESDTTFNNISENETFNTNKPQIESESESESESERESGNKIEKSYKNSLDEITSDMDDI